MALAVTLVTEGADAIWLMLETTVDAWIEVSIVLPKSGASIVAAMVSEPRLHEMSLRFTTVFNGWTASELATRSRLVDANGIDHRAGQDIDADFRPFFQDHLIKVRKLCSTSGPSTKGAIGTPFFSMK